VRCKKDTIGNKGKIRRKTGITRKLNRKVGKPGKREKVASEEKKRMPLLSSGQTACDYQRSVLNNGLQGDTVLRVQTEHDTSTTEVGLRLILVLTGTRFETTNI
jgi:hypothetical protein